MAKNFRPGLYRAPDPDRNRQGIGDAALSEMVPGFNSRASDEVIKNDNNCWIVLGRDRPGDLMSGYGGKGVHAAGAIDIVVGRMAPVPLDQFPKSSTVSWAVEDGPGTSTWDNIVGDPISIDPIFNTVGAPELEGFKLPGVGLLHPAIVMDAARIYISQATDIDRNMKIVPGMAEDEIPPEMMYPRSAIAMKADGVRMIAREGIKLVTGGANYENFNSAGGQITRQGGIDLIAGNGYPDSNEPTKFFPQQSMVLGDKLEECLKKMMLYIEDLHSAFISNVKEQMVFNAAVANHKHSEPVLLGHPGPYSLELVMAAMPADVFTKTAGILKHTASKFNTSGHIWNYLEGTKSPDTFLSQWNSVN